MRHRPPGCRLWQGRQLGSGGAGRTGVFYGQQKIESLTRATDLAQEEA